MNEGKDGGTFPANTAAVGGKDPNGKLQTLLVGTDGSVVTSGNSYQRSSVPSNFAVGTADATVFTLAAGEIGFIQNLDDAALAVKKGAGASTDSLSMILAANTAADAGNGGYVVIDDWIGAVSVAAMSGTARYIAWKQA